MPIGAAWKGRPAGRTRGGVSNLGSTDVGVSLSMVTADKRAISTAKQTLAAGETQLLVFDMLDAVSCAATGITNRDRPCPARASRALRGDSVLRGIPRSGVSCLALRAAADHPARESVGGRRAVGTVGVGAGCGPNSILRHARPSHARARDTSSLKAETKLEAVGDAVGLRPLEFALPHGLPGGSYGVIADTRRVPISGQPSRKARVGTIEVESATPPQPVKATVAPYRGALAVPIAGRPVTGLKHMTYRLDERYVQQFATTGVQVVGFSCGCGEHPYGLAADTWLGRDQFDFSEVEELPQMAGDALAAPTSHCGPLGTIRRSRWSMRHRHRSPTQWRPARENSSILDKGRRLTDWAKITPTFRVVDAEAEVLGVDIQSQHPGLCRTRRDGWESVYSAAPT